MTRQEIIAQIQTKQSFLCVGLDPDPQRLPSSLRGVSAIVDFCKAIIESTSDYCVAYKLNIAFFEGLGRKAWDILYETRMLLPDNCLLIADAKRGDIGNSAQFYARAFFDDLDFDAVTVAPYMGSDSVIPFLEHSGKWTILLALTSNPGAMDFQLMEDNAGNKLFEKVLLQSMTWGTPENLMFVTGATQTAHLQSIRLRAPEHFLLVPGIGAQGGNLEDVARICMNDDCGILVNSSRDIIYASSKEDFAEKAREKAAEYQQKMKVLLSCMPG